LQVSIREASIAQFSAPSSLPANSVSGRFVHVEAMSGVVTAIAAWMLDPVACAGMETIGASRLGGVGAARPVDLLPQRDLRP
jgi:hypothetical protein